MDRLLITGCDGFVGRHFLSRLRQDPLSNTRILATTGPRQSDASLEHTALDVTDESAVETCLRTFEPTHVLHLAGISSPPYVSRNPQIAWQVNTFGTLNLARAIQAYCPKCFLVFVGSGLVYGTTARAGLPIREDALLAPDSEYAVTKAAADLGVGFLAEKGLRAVRLRPFNHAGPGQVETFVIPSFAAQIARIEAGLQPPEIKVGNLDVERDFLDVRDVVESYIAVIRRSDMLAPGQIINIASGVPRKVGDILYQLLARSPAKITVKQDQSRVRGNEISRYVGDPSLAQKLLQWTPSCDFDSTLADVLTDWRQSVASFV
jgi:GDP-4-dehydro-6-deoxy-D-mannose reductase